MRSCTAWWYMAFCTFAALMTKGPGEREVMEAAENEALRLLARMRAEAAANEE